MIRALIFDLDGTLLDTLEDLADATNAALRACDLPERTIDEVRMFVGNGVRNLMLRAVPGGEENPRFEEAFAFFKKYYGAHCKEKTGPYAGIMELLQELKDRGIGTAIVSNKIDSAVKALDREYFYGLTQAAIGEMEGIARKPAPDTVFKAMEELKVGPEDAIYVGDSDVDIETARNAGLACISVTWGFRDEDFLKEHGAATLVHRPEEILKLLTDQSRMCEEA